jgi:hypothetical protein
MKFLTINILCKGEIIFKVYHIGQKGPNPYCNLFLSYISIPIKNNDSKVINFLKIYIFKIITIIIIHKYILT